MSNTVQEIVDRAHAKLGIKGAYQALDSTQSANGLRALKSVYRHLITSGAFGDLLEIVPTASLTATEFTRLTITGAYTVTLPALVLGCVLFDDYGDIGCVPDPNSPQPPTDCAVVTVTNNSGSSITVVNGSNDTITAGSTADYIYDGQTKKWLQVDSLTLSSPAPLSRRDDNGLCALLATHLADEYGMQPTPTIMVHARGYMLGLTQNWSQAGEEPNRGDYF